MDVASVAEKAAFRAEKMNKVNLFETPRMFCDIYCLEPGQSQRLHAHDGQDKVYFVLEGEGTFQVDDDEQTLGPGRAVLAPSGSQHGVRNASGQRVTLLVFVSPNPNVSG